MFYVYILRGSNGRYYVGQTEDLKKRLDYHNSKSARWTARFQPWKLIYYEECSTRSEAIKRERYLKNRKNTERTVLRLNGM
jgi:putative endonuclease